MNRIRLNLVQDRVGERRLSHREPAQLNTRLHLTNGDTQESIITDISFSGLFITTEYYEPVLMREGSKITMEFRFDCDGLQKRFFETVKIVRGADNGIAVSFVEYNSTHFNILQRILRNARIQKEEFALQQETERDQPQHHHINNAAS